MLEFDGVYRDAMVYVNGNLAGQRAFGYSRFVVRIDPFLVFGAENEIRVECRTHLDSRWYAGAGIYRDVHLDREGGRAHRCRRRQGHHTGRRQRRRRGRGRRRHRERRAATTTTYRLDVLIVDARAARSSAHGSSPVTVLPGDAGDRPTPAVRRRIRRCGASTAPNLYVVRLDAPRRRPTSSTKKRRSFGIRSLQLDPRHGLRINGETVKLRGACIHPDNGPLGAAAMRPSRGAQDRAAERGRLQRHPQLPQPDEHARLLDACDRLGMLVMDETFDVWTSGKSDFDYAFDFPEWWERDVEAMVAKDFNHPSVDLLLDRQRDPRDGQPDRRRSGVVGSPRRCARSTPRGSSPTASTRSSAMLDMIVPQMKARREAAAETAGVAASTR